MGQAVLLFPEVKGHSSHPSKHRQEPRHLAANGLGGQASERAQLLLTTEEPYSSPRDWSQTCPCYPKPGWGALWRFTPTGAL